MPPYLEHLAHALSYCSEKQRVENKAGNKKEAAHWLEIHTTIHKACVAIGYINYANIEKKG